MISGEMKEAGGLPSKLGGMESDFARILASDISRSVTLYALLLKELRAQTPESEKEWFTSSLQGLRALMKGLAETSCVLAASAEPTGTEDDKVVREALHLLRGMLESTVLVALYHSIKELERVPLLTERHIDELLQGTSLEFFLKGYNALPV